MSNMSTIDLVANSETLHSNTKLRIEKTKSDVKAYGKKI